MRTADLVVLLTLIAAPAMAQDAGSAAPAPEITAPFDAESAIRGFLDAPSLPGVVSAAAGNVSVAGTSVRLDGFAVVFEMPLPAEPGIDADSARLELTAPVALVDGLRRSPEGYAADAIRLPAARLAGTLNDPAGAKTFDLALDRTEIRAPRWPVSQPPAASGGPVATLEPGLRFIAALSAESLTTGAAGTALTLEGVERGRIAAATFSDPAPQTGDGSEDDGTPQTITLTGLDLAVIADALFKDGGAPGVALAGLTVSGSALPESPDGTAVSFGGGRVEGVTLTPQSPPLASRLDDLAALRMAGELHAPEVLEPGTPAPPPPPEQVDLALALWQAIGIDTLTFDGFDVDAPDGRSGLDQWRVDNIGFDRAIDVTMSGLSVMRDDVSFSIGAIEVAGIRVPEPHFMRAAALVGSATPPPDVILGMIPTVRQVRIGDYVIGRDDVATFRIDQATFELGDFVGTIPTELTWHSNSSAHIADGFRPDGTLDADMVRLLRERNLTSFSLFDEGHIAYTEDGRLSVTLASRLTDLLEYRIALTLSGIPRYILTDPTRVAEVVAFISLDSFSATVTDHGAVSVASELVGARAGVDVAAQIAAQAATVEASLASVIGPEPARSATEALVRFSGGGHTLTLTATPDRPVALTQLALASQTAPASLVDILKLALTTTP